MMQRLAADTSGWRRLPHVWIALLLIAALGWIVTIQQASGMAGMSQHSGGMGGMATSRTSAVVFLPVWVAMMAAMMFPAMAPVVSLFGAVGRKRRQDGNNAVPTSIFVAGYLVVMNLTAMVLLAALIFAQKALPYGDLIGKAAGLVLLTTGLAFALAPVV